LMFVVTALIVDFRGQSSSWRRSARRPSCTSARRCWCRSFSAPRGRRCSGCGSCWRSFR
jgi:hypothetical protein